MSRDGVGRGVCGMAVGRVSGVEGACTVMEERLGVLQEPLGEAGEEHPEQGAFGGPISFLWLP